MDGMFMCAIHKEKAWGSLAFCNQVVQDRQSLNWAEHFLVKQLNSNEVTIRRHWSLLPRYEVRFSSPLLFNGLNPPRRSPLQNNSTFSESYGHRTSVTAWADREHLVLFLEGRRKPQPYTNSRREPWNSQEYSEVWLLLRRPGAVAISCWLWRCYSWQVLFCGEGYVMWPVGAIKTTSPHACTHGECARKSMWCQVQFTTRIVTDVGS